MKFPFLKETKNRVCNRCVMDTTATNIQFNDEGICNYCSAYFKQQKKMLGSEEELNKIVTKIKEEGKRKKYDCIIGVSGGVDSTYVAYYVKKLGLRPLAVHLDNGWDSELAVGNIERRRSTTLPSILNGMAPSWGSLLSAISSLPIILNLVTTAP